MGTISNDFLTITYNNEQQEKMANYYMRIINNEPEFFKAILNGLNTIKGYELRKFKIDEKDSFRNIERKKFSIIDSILKLTNAKNPYFYTCKVSKPDVYYDVLAVKRNDKKKSFKSQIEYFDLAQDYYYMTGDPKYIKKYLYEEIDFKVLEELSDNKVLKCFPELLKTKMHEDKYSFGSYSYKLLQDNIDVILQIIPVINNWTYNELDRVENKENYYEKLPKINEKEFEKLVMGALNYIDPTNKLVEKYIEFKNDQRIVKTPMKDNNDDSQYDRHKGIIELSVSNTITDVIVFAHEFAHYNYDEEDEIHVNNAILSEYASIYYETKTIEYLGKQGYTYDEIINAKIFRSIANENGLHATAPCLKYISIIKNKDEYTAIEDTIAYINYFVDEMYNHLSEEEKKDTEEETKKEMRIGLSYLILKPARDTLNHVKYLMGTFLATISSTYMKNEDVLQILEHIQNNKVSLEDVMTMQCSNSIYDSNYQKAKEE